MDRALLIALAVSALVLVAVLVVGLLAARGRRRLRADLESSRRDVAALRDRLDELSRQVARTTEAPDRAPTAGARPSEQFLITTLPDGTAGDEPPAGTESTVSAGAFASVALGESLVRVVSFAYGVRRAMSAENRNRIRFEMQREVKRSRRQRRRDLREARRHLHSEQRTGLTEDAA